MNADYPLPLIPQRADPFIYKHTDGYYYFTASVPEYDRIELRRAKTIRALADAETANIWKKHPKGEMSELIWAPEIHFINGQWVIYFAAGDSMEVLGHRMYALVSDRPNPLEGGFREAGKIHTGRDAFALDATTFFLDTQQYYVWAEQDAMIPGHSNLYIANMSDPFTLSSKPVMLSYPEYGWECVNFKVNEGPAALLRGNRVFLSYSASGVDRNYCMGLLWADRNDDLLDASVWCKSPVPVFKTSDRNSLFGPGHNSFTVAEDGKTDLLVYHARTYEKVEGDPLYDPNRHTCVQPIAWDAQGMPVFGEPGELFSMG